MTDDPMDLNEFISQMPLNNLNEYYDIEASVFKKRIEKLNLKFYWESEALTTQKEIEKPYNKLFLILFKQVSLYLEEIDRLNSIIIDKNKTEKINKEKIYELTKREKERIMTKQMLNNYQKSNKLLEKRLKEKCLQEDKYKMEIEKLKQQVQYAREQPTINTSTITNQSMTNKKKCRPGDGYNTLQTDNNNKRSSHSIENRVVNNNKMKKPNDGKNNLNQSMTLPGQECKKTIGSSQMLMAFEAHDNEEFMSNCLKYYDEEMEHLNEIEMFLLKQRQDVTDICTKQASTSTTTMSNSTIVKSSSAKGKK